MRTSKYIHTNTYRGVHTHTHMQYATGIQAKLHACDRHTSTTVHANTDKHAYTHTQHVVACDLATTDQACDMQQSDLHCEVKTTIKLSE